MKISLLLLSLVISLNSVSQDYVQTIRGKVIDKAAQQPLTGASVVVEGSEPVIGTVTDANGDFEIKNIRIGRHSLVISFVGYNPAKISNLLLQSGKEAVVTVELVEKIENLKEVTVTSYSRKDKTLNEMALISARSFTIEETERFAGSLGDPARMVSNYAGVDMQNDSRNDIIIRGNSPIGLVWRLDDVEIPNPNHFGAMGTTGGPVSMLNNNLLTNSDFYTGAFPAQFGNGISGAFDLRLRQGNNTKAEYTGQVGFNGFEFGAEGPFSKKRKGSYIINGRYSTLALMHKIGFGTGTGTAVPYYQDLTVKADMPTKKAGKFSFFTIIGKSNIELGANPDDTTENMYNMYGQHTDYAATQIVSGFSNLYFFTNNTRMKTVISYQRTTNKALVDQLDMQTRTLDAYYRSNDEHTRYSAAVHLKSKLNIKNNIGAGIIADYNTIFLKDSVFNNFFDKFLILNNTDGSFGVYKAYGQYQRRFSEKFTAYSGLHILHTTLADEISAEPRISLEWNINNVNSLSAGYGRHSQLQPYSVYFMQYYNEFTGEYTRTNRNVKMTKADHYVIGYNKLFSKDLRIKIETYYQNLFNVPVSQIDKQYSMLNAGDFFGIMPVDSLENSGKGVNYGVELTFEKFLSRGYYFLFTTSLFDSRYTAFDNVWRNTAFNSNYVINLLGGYEFKAGKRSFFTFDLKAVCAGGKRYIPIILEESIAQGEAVYDYPNSFKNKFDTYFRADLRLGYKINGKKLMQEWAVDFQNVTTNKSTFMQGYNDSSKEIYSVYQMGFYPMFLYRIQF